MPKAGGKSPIGSGAPLSQGKRASEDPFEQTKRIWPRASADPNQINKIELRCASATRVEVRIYSERHTETELFAFPDMASAVDFCHQIWKRRW